MKFDIITIFPNIFDSYLNEGILKRALGFKKKISVRVHNLRDFTSDKHQMVDDRPYGGGAGMLLKPEPLIKAIVKIRGKKRRKPVVAPKRRYGEAKRVILFSAKGKVLTQQDAVRLAKYDNLIMICGRYEGVDERVLNFVDEEISIGSYVLTGGELPALVLLDAVTRLIPGVLGHEASNVDESHSTPGVLEYPHFTRPEKLLLTPAQKKYIVAKKKNRISLEVPEVLMSGHHEKIEKWREGEKRKQE